VQVTHFTATGNPSAKQPAKRPRNRARLQPELKQIAYLPFFSSPARMGTVVEAPVEEIDSWLQSSQTRNGKVLTGSGNLDGQISHC
jgi:hypothetical protein